MRIAREQIRRLIVCYFISVVAIATVGQAGRRDSVAPSSRSQNLIFTALYLVVSVANSLQVLVKTLPTCDIWPKIAKRRHPPLRLKLIIFTPVYSVLGAAQLTIFAQLSVVRTVLRVEGEDYDRFEWDLANGESKRFPTWL